MGVIRYNIQSSDPVGVLKYESESDGIGSVNTQSMNPVGVLN